MTLRIEWTGLIIRYWFGFGERLAVIYPPCSYNAVIDMTGSLRLFVGITRHLVLAGVNPGSQTFCCNDQCLVFCLGVCVVSPVRHLHISLCDQTPPPRVNTSPVSFIRIVHKTERVWTRCQRHLLFR